LFSSSNRISDETSWPDYSDSFFKKDDFVPKFRETIVNKGERRGFKRESATGQGQTNLKKSRRFSAASRLADIKAG
jgi:hypothetical protein